MHVTRVDSGLWRWTASHPAWTPAADWPREVACVYWETPEAVALVDPLVPSEPDERERFWRALDRDVERLGQPVVVILTCSWHERSTQEIIGRYGARLADTGTAAAGGAVAYPVAEEVVLWLPAPRTVVVGDVLVGDELGGLRLCPASWLPDGLTPAEAASALEPLLDLPAERILVSHGEPVLAGGAAALAAAVRAAGGAKAQAPAQ